MKVTRRLRDQLGSARDVAEQATEKARQRLGRTDEAPEPPAPDAQGNRPGATFAGVLDGRHLWLAVDATPGSLALREAGPDPTTGTVVPLASDLAEDDPRFRSVRSDLAALPGSGAGRYEVVITAPGGKVHRVWTPPLRRNEPVLTPASGEVQWRVARTGDGTLELVREPAPPGALLVGIDIDADDVTTLRVEGAAPGARAPPRRRRERRGAGDPAAVRRRRRRRRDAEPGGRARGGRALRGRARRRPARTSPGQRPRPAGQRRAPPPGAERRGRRRGRRGPAVRDRLPLAARRGAAGAEAEGPVPRVSPGCPQECPRTS